MKKKTNRLGSLPIKIIALAASTASAGCAGLDLHTDFAGQFSLGEYTEKTGKIPKVGGVISEGISEGIFSHRLSVGVRYGQLPAAPPETHPFIVGKFIDEEVQETSGKTDSIDIFFMAERQVWQVKPSSWYQFAVLLGGGMQINVTNSTSTVKIGDSHPTQVPNVNPVNEFRGFVNQKLEVVLGPDYAAFPIQLDTRVYLENCDNFQSCVDPSVSLGYRINWGAVVKKKESPCRYMPDRKTIPLEFRLEVDRRETDSTCAEGYHSGGSEARHLGITLYACEGEECTELYNSLVRSEKADKEVKKLDTSDECFAVERDFEGIKERTLYCNLVNIVYYETVTFRSGDNRDLARIPNNVAQKVLKELSR